MNALLTPETLAHADLDGAEHYEVVDGIRRELPPMGAFESTLASFLAFQVNPFAQANNLGRVVVETLFQLDREGKLQRKPDVAFISYKRWPKNQRVPRTNAWEVIPNLAVEVNSPTNTADEVLVIIQDYFRTGVERVWIVYPVVQQVYVYSSPTDVRIIPNNGELSGETLLPGFRLPLAVLFEEDVPASAP